MLGPGRPAPKPKPGLETATLRVAKHTVGQASASDGDTIESHGTAIRLTVANEGMAGDHVLQQEKRCVDDQAPEQQEPGPAANSTALAASRLRMRSRLLRRYKDRKSTRLNSSH